MNDGISTSLRSPSYDDAAILILSLARACELVKIDLKVLVHPDDQHLLAIIWGGHTYVDRALPFGMRSAPKIFSPVADGK